MSAISDPAAMMPMAISAGTIWVEKPRTMNPIVSPRAPTSIAGARFRRARIAPAPIAPTTPPTPTAALR